ncbi:MAG: hypothetical protein HOM11_18020 [Methylococcales bacterium]|jgi:nickel/cobalt transporter (NicO) family protein|nr:hypothetical protein [Methylococcales bacterium]MBT7442422.1 hypothetical protein [Methylococcales bacterium]
MSELDLIAPLSSLAFGFSLGFIHAFDADHLMAISVMAQGKKKASSYLQYSSRWALGHGAVLLILGMLLTGFGFTLPDAVAAWSEKLIGLLLIIFGSLLLAQLHIKTKANASKGHKGTPLFIGVIHGFAGNAPVLALLPALSQSSITAAISYLFLFSLGLLASMTLFAFSLSLIQRRLQQHPMWLRYATTGIGMTSMLVGALWLSH